MGINEDARKYHYELPVVAHPPCQLWGNFAAINYKRWGGEHNKPGNDGGCFLSALNTVERCGGVLEHPADTRAWKTYGLDKPTGIGWRSSRSGYVCEVWQTAYGHKCRKRTWLYYCGTNAPLEMKWDRLPGTHQIGQPDKRIQSNYKPVLSGSAASATPLPFAQALIALAKNSRI